MENLSLELTDWQFGYGTPLYTPLNLQCRKGEIIALLGTNGRGKTTLLHSLLGVVAPLAGKMRTQGQIGFVPQAFQTPDYSVLDIVLMGRALKISPFSLPSAQDEQAARQALHALGLDAFARQNINALSGGQRQLVLIARALATDCQILMLDEPTAALDVFNQQRILNLIARLARQRNMTVLFSTHEPYHALCVAHRVLLLQKDKRWQYGATAEVLTETALYEAYGLPIRYGQIDGQKILTPLFKLENQHE